jgi:hypothetical protein
MKPGGTERLPGAAASRPLACVRAAPALPLPLLALLLLTLFAAPLPASDFALDEDILVASFWTELDPMVDEPRPGPLERREAIERTLEEVRIVLSGMIYGYRLRYVPRDTSRGVAEELSMEPIAEIERGDERLRVLDTRTEEGRFHVRVRYNLADFQQRRRAMWRSNTIPDESGRGSAPLSEGYRGKYLAFREAVKQALRAYLRPRELNKPRSIRAEILYLEPPYVTIDAGGYRAKVRIKIRLKEVLPYSVY